MKKASMIYLEAARVVAEGRANFWGYALDVAGQPKPGSDSSPLQARLLQEFSMQSSRYDDFDSGESIIALLFMHQIAKDEENK